MSIEKSIAWLSKRLKNEYDIKSLNEIIVWVNNQKEKSVNNNQLFAKLYIYFLNQKINEFETTVFEDIPQKELSKLLATPLYLFYKSFQQQFNQNVMDQVFKENGLSVKHPLLKTEDEKNEDELKFKNMSKEDVKKIITDVYDIDYIEDRLNEAISEAINRY